MNFHKALQISGFSGLWLGYRRVASFPEIRSFNSASAPISLLEYRARRQLPQQLWFAPAALVHEFLRTEGAPPPPPADEESSSAEGESGASWRHADTSWGAGPKGTGGKEGQNCTGLLVSVGEATNAAFRGSQKEDQVWKKSD